MARSLRALRSVSGNEVADGYPHRQGLTQLLGILRGLGSPSASSQRTALPAPVKKKSWEPASELRPCRRTRAASMRSPRRLEFRHGRVAFHRRSYLMAKSQFDTIAESLAFRRQFPDGRIENVARLGNRVVVNRRAGGSQQCAGGIAEAILDRGLAAPAQTFGVGRAQALGLRLLVDHREIFIQAAGHFRVDRGHFIRKNLQFGLRSRGGRCRRIADGWRLGVRGRNQEKHRSRNRR